MWGSLPRMQPNNDLISTSNSSVEFSDSNLKTSKSHGPFTTPNHADGPNNPDSLFYSCSGNFYF